MLARLEDAADEEEPAIAVLVDRPRGSMRSTSAGRDAQPVGQLAGGISSGT